MLKRKHSISLRKDESGVVSLLVVTIMTVILALVSIGFSHLMDRELRSALDRQLSAQAYYAARSGLDDARAYLAANGGNLTGCTDWQNSPLGRQYFVSDLSGGRGAAKYSCVSINTTPNELIYTVKAGQSVTLHIDRTGMGKLYFSWENQSYNNGPQPLGNLGVLPKEGNLPADDTGLLRVGLYPVGRSTTNTTNNDLAVASRTYLLYPNGGSGGINCNNGINGGCVDYTKGSYSNSSGPGGNNGSFVAGNCHSNNSNPIKNSETGGRYCNSVITGLNGSADTYYVTLTAQYQPLIITVQATKGSNSNNPVPLAFDGTQAIVDVTGQGTDVLQRIRARIDLDNQYQLPQYGIQSMMAVCKGFRVNITGLATYGAASNSMMSSYDNTGACALTDSGGHVTRVPGELPPH